MSDEYPKFLQKKPSGEDSFEGKSQENIANVISRQIRENSETHKMIGIEGVWGSGKSNLLEILKKKLDIEKDISKDGKYVFFLYDVWAHQEDLQRKSILTELVSKLCNLEIAEILRKKNYWCEKVKSLTGTFIERKVKNTPKFSWGLIFTILVIICSPALEPIADLLPNCQILYKILILSIPMLIVLIQILYYAIFDSLSNFISIYKDKEIESSNTEFTHESNPSVSEFNEFMSELSEELGDKKLILVFDNMDRLPIEKVKDLWSSIHTFFAEARYNNIITIMTFDRGHIRKAFENTDVDDYDNEKSTGDDNEKFVGDDYINKTFDIVYRVSLPVINDWKNFLRKEWRLAFGETFDEKEYNRVEQVYDMLSDSLSFTPRKIIGFINEIVSIELVLEQNIPERYIAIFVLAKNSILKDSFNAIINKKYLGKIKYIYENDSGLDKYMTSLVYQINPAKSLSIVYTQSLATAFEKVDKKVIETIASSSFINSILNDAIQYTRNLENLILSIDYLQNGVSNSNVDNNYIEQIWSDLFQKLQKENNLQESDKELFEYQKCLLKNLQDDAKKNYVKKIVVSLEISEKFNSLGYFDIITELDGYFEVDYIKSILSEKKIDPKNYLSFIEHSKNNQSKVKITCDSSELDAYLTTFDLASILKIDYLQYIPNRYELKNFNLTLNNNMVNAITDLSKFSLLVGLLKSINQKTIDISRLQIDANFNNLCAQAKNSFKYDLVAMAIVKNYFIPTVETILHNPTEANISGLSNCIEKYMIFGNILLGLKTYNKYELYKKVCSKLISTEDESNQYANITELLKNFSMICNNSDVIPSQLILKLSRWNFEMLITNPEIKRILNLDVLNAAIETKCELSKKCINVAKQYLESFTEENWKESLLDFSKYGIHEALIIKYKWNAVFKNALESILKGIAKSEYEVPSNKNEWFDLVGKIGSVSTIMKNVRDEFCSGRAVIDDKKFIFFSKWLFESAKLEEKADSLRTIIPNSLLNNEECMNILVDKKSTVKLIVEKADTPDATEFNQKIIDSVIANKNSILKPLFDILKLKIPSASNEENVETKSRGQD